MTTIQERIAHLEEQILKNNFATLDHITRMRAHVYKYAPLPDQDFHSMLFEILTKGEQKRESEILTKKVKDLTKEDWFDVPYFDDMDDVIYSLCDLGISEKRAMNMKLATAISKIGA